MKKELRAWLVMLAWIVVGTSPVAYAYLSEKPEEDVWIESTEDVLRFDMEEVEVELEVEETEDEVVTVHPAYTDGVRFYNVPLDEKYQLHVFEECDGYDFWPHIALAIMDAESDYQKEVVSKYGDIGLMQVNPKWHYDRMERLNCYDLFDPYQNITVAIDYLAYLKNQSSDICWIIMAYNKGPSYATDMVSKGKVNDYALEVLTRAMELQAEYERMDEEG